MTDGFSHGNPIARPDRTALALVALLFLSTSLLACGGDADGSDAASSAPATEEPGTGPGGQEVRTEKIRIGDVTVTAEIADSDDLRARGLMNRDSLPENHGMLFVYGTAQVRSFWMRNTRIPLDIAFIDAGGVIINIERMEPQSDQNYYSQGPMMYALEMDQGWFEANDVGPGDRLEF